MKHVISILATLGLAATAVVAEEEPGLDDPKVKAKIVANAWSSERLGQQRDGKLVRRDGGVPHTGWVKHRHANGQLAKLIPFKNGKLDGPQTLWHKNGQMRHQGTFKNGKKDGIYTMWFENGTLLDKAPWKNGVKVK